MCKKTLTKTTGTMGNISFVPINPQCSPQLTFSLDGKIRMLNKNDDGHCGSHITIFNRRISKLYLQHNAVLFLQDIVFSLLVFFSKYGVYSQIWNIVSKYSTAQKKCKRNIRRFDENVAFMAQLRSIVFLARI